MADFERYCEANADADQASEMAAYMKHRFPFFGIKQPIRKIIVRSVFELNDPLSKQDVVSVLNECWARNEREWQYIGLDILDRYKRYHVNLEPGWLETLIIQKSWWDTVDLIASNAVGNRFRKDSVARSECIDKWSTSENMWLNRTCLLFQLKYGYEADFELLSHLCRLYSSSPEFFIQKAIGWSLRQHAKLFPDDVCAFVRQTPLAALSEREALKHIECS